MTLSQLIATGINFIAAVFFGMLGVGAAPVFLVTLQSLGYGMIATVFPLAILLNGINSGFALIPFSRAKAVDWKNGPLLSAVAGIFAFLGAYLAVYVPVKVLLIALIAVLAFLGLKTLTMVNVQESDGRPDRKRVLILGIPAAVIAGFFGGLLAVGGGGIFAPFLLIAGYKMKDASGTTALVATVASFTGFLGFIAHANIPGSFTLISVITVAVGSILGAYLALKVAKPSWLRLILGLIILISALKMFINII